VINPRLVRGLDYYSRTVFEWVTNLLGAQGTVCAGGRYDGLVTQLGGRETPAIGFAMGVERLIAVMEELGRFDELSPPVDAYLVLAGDQAQVIGLGLAEQLRDDIPSLRLMTHCGGGSMKSQFRKADKSGAPIALVLGDQEVESEQIAVKFLRDQRDQEMVAWDDLTEFLTSLQFEA
jgi:histidyl-tRNA synthetase